MKTARKLKRIQKTRQRKNGAERKKKGKKKKKLTSNPHPIPFHLPPLTSI